MEKEKIIMSSITCEQVMEAYNTLINYCRDQELCADCLLSISCDKFPECFFMNASEPPEDWEALDFNN